MKFHSTHANDGEIKVKYYMKKILIIEGNTELRTGIAEILKYEGYCISEAFTGIEGLQIARKEVPDLILCDIKIQGISGYQVLKELRKEKAFSSTSFIYITALDEKTCFRHCMEIGADDFLSKPFSRKELLHAISSRLERISVLEQDLQQTFKTDEDNLLKELSALQAQLNHHKNLVNKSMINIEELKQKLREKELEFIKESMQITKTNMLLQNFRAQIDNELQNRLISGMQKKIFIDLKSKIKNGSPLPCKLSVFQLEFNQTFPNLTSKFMHRFSHLTQYDLVLISATALGLKTYQLADLLNVSIDSVRKSKYRLKKKLSLGKNDDLLKFIESIHSGS